MSRLSIYHAHQDLLVENTVDKDLYHSFHHHHGTSFSGIEMHFFEFKARKDHELSAEYNAPGYKITVCLDGYSENLSPINEPYFFESGKALLYNIREGKSKSIIKNNMKMSILHLYLPETLLAMNQPKVRKEYRVVPYKISVDNLNRLFSVANLNFYEKAKAESKLFEMLSEVFLLADFSVAKSEKGISENVVLARDILDASPEEFITIGSLARMVGTNEFKLKKEFKYLTGKGVFEYQQDQKLGKALFLLKQGYSIEQVATIVGYSHAGNFSNAFYQKYQIRPGKITNS